MQNTLAGTKRGDDGELPKSHSLLERESWENMVGSKIGLNDANMRVHVGHVGHIAAVVDL
jgi:hypothetical protein